MESKRLTKGFRMNHVGIRVANLEKSIGFYSGILGMQELCRLPLDTVTVVFLGYPDSAGSEAAVFAREGVLELVCTKELSNTSENPNNHTDSRFVKLGFTVPDLGKAMEYLNGHDVRVLKHAGTTEHSEIAASFLGCATPDKGFDKWLWESVVPIPFIADPDGYMIEIIPY